MIIFKGNNFILRLLGTIPVKQGDLCSIWEFRHLKYHRVFQILLDNITLTESILYRYQYCKSSPHDD